MKFSADFVCFLQIGKSLQNHAAMTGGLYNKNSRGKSCCGCFLFCRYIHFREICSRKMNSICFRYAANPSRSSSIYCRFAPIRYKINPSFAKQTYRVRQHISSLYISPLARYANHIENHMRDLSRCVFSVKDNTLIFRVTF